MAEYFQRNARTYRYVRNGRGFDELRANRPASTALAVLSPAEAVASALMILAYWDGWTGCEEELIKVGSTMRHYTCILI